MISRQRVFVFLKKTLSVVAVIFILAFLPILMQYLHLLDIREVRHWVQVFTNPYKVNLAIVVLLFFCCYVLFNSVFTALSAVTVFCLTFSIVDMQKMRILHQPLLPGDLLFFKQALLIASIYFSQVLAGCAVLAAILVGTVMLRGRVPRYRLPAAARLILVILLGILLWGIVGNYHPVIISINKRYRIVNEFWNQLSNFRKNGVLYGFLLNIESLKIAKPPQYGKAAIDRIFFVDSTTVELPRPPSAAASTASLPDVIVYMNESFWDITKITSVKLPRDPIPVFRRIGKRSLSTRLVSPVFGGNTCIAEFELLTGMSHGYFPPGAIAYNQFIQHPVPSLVRVFKENGYRTIAIHSFKKWFWNRHNVYRYLGFDTFLSVESMERPALKGTFVGDEELARYIVNHADSGSGPCFIFALSMQNHGHYSYKRYDSLDCPVTTGLSATADLEYNTYLQGIIDADKSLKIIVDYIKKTSKPTLLVFFGDHLPGFTHVYRETGYEQRMNEDTISRYTTTAVWFANFPLKKTGDKTISMVYLPLLLSRQAGIAVPPYYRLLDGIGSAYPIFTGEKRIDAAGRAVEPTALTKAQDDACRMLVYDALLGKGYAERYHRVAREKAVKDSVTAPQ
ncbi:MAG: LTA synthase family protein [Chitinispirillaceae bacterium]|nr:LTA synthase family protein [Chitinispirillaceae bacterium]